MTATADSALGRLGVWGAWLHPDAPKLLASAGVELVPVPDGGDPTDVSGALDALYLRPPYLLTDDLIDGLPRLRLIAVAGAGTEIVDLDAATSREVPVLHGRGLGARAVAEWTVGAALWLVRDVGRLHDAVAKGRWRARSDSGGRRDLGSLSIGICGFGHIGSLVASMLANAFDSAILVTEPDVRRSDVAREAGFEVVELDELLRRSDVVTVHAGAALGDPPLLDRQHLALMQSTAVMINTSRGQLVDLDAVADLLDAGRIGGVAIDVFPDEPPSPELVQRLQRHSRVLLSPHASGMTDDAVRALATGVAEDIVRTLRGGRPERCVNPEVLP